VDAGRCETCKEKALSMVFMADVNQFCETCNGKRFKKELLKLHLLGKIFTILTMTIDDAVAFF
jgi:excinuclease ABC subunit A